MVTNGTVSAVAPRSNPKILSPAALCHVVLRTSEAHFEPLIQFYSDALGARVVHKSHRLAFLSYDDEHHRIALVVDPAAVPADPASPRVGMHHMAFGYPALPDLVTSYEQKKAAGIRPAWCVNHGPTTSMYYKDPDGNMLEFQVDNFDSAEAADAYMQSPPFQENPIGADFDPEVFVQRVRSGESEASIKARPDIGPRDRP